MKANKKSQENIILSQWLEVIVIFIAIITFIVSLNILTEFFSNKKKVESVKYVYGIQNDLDYKVYMFDNNFFDETYLDMNKNYMSKLVNTINFNYNNILTISKISNIEYDYTVNATIKAETKEQTDYYDSVVWTKKYTLIPTKYGKINEQTENNIDIPIVIDYQVYRQLVSEFQNQMRLDVDSYLDIQIIINYKFYVDGDKVNKTENAHIKVPLSGQTFKIKSDYQKQTEETVYNEIEIEKNSIKLLGGIILFVSSLFCCIVLIAILIKDTKKAEYIIKLNKILKNYGDIMARVRKLPSIEGKEIYELDDFSDLINIEEELKIPIIYYEKKVNKEGWFLIIHFDIVYRFILREKENIKTKKY